MKTIALFASATLLSACSQLPVSIYADTPIQFDPMSFFNNQIHAEGFVRDRSGEVSRTFTAQISATWDEQGGVLDELFTWSDGEIQTRVWQFRKTGEQTYVGTAADVIGDAQMEFAGNAIHMNYVLDVPLASGKSIGIRMDDWLYQVSDNSIVNVTSMSKFGFSVGEVVLTMRVID